MDKMPVWLSAVEVGFVCTNCPKRQTRPVNLIERDTTRPEGGPSERLEDESEHDDADSDEDELGDDI